MRAFCTALKYQAMLTWPSLSQQSEVT